MDITLQYFEGCPNWTETDERISVVAAERPDIHIHRQIVDTPEEAERIGFHGSPSVLVDGIDPFAEPGTAVGLACRRYRTPDGFAGAPTLEQLRTAVSDA
ncbi:hypothetical protein GCM10027020_09430 [Nocardioides salsibiostraticola]